ncbi:MAG: FkbM family methyltransferase [Pseudomonadota bacterium]
MRATLGVLKSLLTYRVSRRHAAGLTALYRSFVRQGGLVFDIGAHAGDRIAAFRALGARVVAVEPQPAMMRLLRLLHGRDRQVALIEAALGPIAGRAALRINRANPTVSTLSESFIKATQSAPGWEGQAWDGQCAVAVTTLDALIGEYGRPDFIKIDVEGHEAAVLAGLSSPVTALSFEIVTAARAAGQAALQAAEALGYRRFRLSLGESHVWEGGWTDAAGMHALLDALPAEANSGDVYCRLAG